MGEHEVCSLFVCYRAELQVRRVGVKRESIELMSFPVQH
jgi:hypothetical protein